MNVKKNFILTALILQMQRINVTFQQESKSCIMRGNQAFYHRAMPGFRTVFQIDLNALEVSIVVAVFAIQL